MTWWGADAGPIDAETLAFALALLWAVVSGLILVHSAYGDKAWIWFWGALFVGSSVAAAYFLWRLL